MNRPLDPSPLIGPLGRHPLSRRGFVAAAGGMVGLLAAGCGSSQDSAAPAAASSGSAGAASATTDTPPAPVKDDRGKAVQLQSRPTRVIATYDGLDVQNIIALGITPLSAGDSATQDDRPAPWVDPYLKNVEYLSTADGLQFEKMAALDPEIIISSYYDKETYDKLEQIAPLFMIPNAMDWRGQLDAVGQVLWREAEAKKAAEPVDRAFAEAKQKLAKRAGEKLAVISTFGGDPSTVYLSTTGDGIGLTLAKLGFAGIPAPEKAGDSFIKMSTEQITKITGDRLLILDFDYDQKGPSPTTAKLLAGPLGKQIPAAARGGVVWMSKAATNASYLDTCLSLPYLVNELVTKLA